MNTETRTNKPVLLWFDCCTSTPTPSFIPGVEQRFMVGRDVGLGHFEASIARYRPRVLAFEFDYPDRAQLRLMQVVRRTYAALPLLMFTVQHSESLAVWALRSRVWNYYVKPIDAEELAHDLAELVRIVAARTADAPHSPYWPAQGLPSELPAQSRRSRFTALRPALSYVKQRFREQVRESEVAALCGLTRFEFSRTFHKTFGLTYIDYVLKLRIREAQRLLRVPGARASEVGSAVGFNDPSYFGRVFRQRLGLAPTAWARREVERAAANERVTKAPASMQDVGEFVAL